MKLGRLPRFFPQQHEHVCDVLRVDYRGADEKRERAEFLGRANIFPMCGRSKLTASPEDLRSLFDLDHVPELEPHYNIAPTQPIAVIRRPGRLERLRFGLIPPWAKQASEGTRFINARAESVARLPVFREALRERRCLVILDAFYEWSHGPLRKQPYVVRMRSGEPFALAGLWGSWVSPDGEVVESVAIVTAPAAGVVAPLHDRMPVILAASAYATWLDHVGPPPSPLLLAARVEELEATAVSTAVNNPKNDGAECVAPPEPTLFR